MGILDTIQSLAGQAGQSAGTDQAKVAGGFIEALTQHPEGIQGVLDAFKNNGMAEHVGAWSNGQNATATPEQVQQGLGGTGLIETTAAKAGVSPRLFRWRLRRFCRWRFSTSRRMGRLLRRARWAAWPSSFWGSFSSASC